MHHGTRQELKNISHELRELWLVKEVVQRSCITWFLYSQAFLFQAMWLHWMLKNQSLVLSLRMSWLLFCCLFPFLLKDFCSALEFCVRVNIIVSFSKWKTAGQKRSSFQFVLSKSLFTLLLLGKETSPVVKKGSLSFDCWKKTKKIRQLQAVAGETRICELVPKF